MSAVFGYLFKRRVCKIHETVSEHCAFAERSQVMKLFSTVEGQMQHIVPELLQ